MKILINILSATLVIISPAIGQKITNIPTCSDSILLVTENNLAKLTEAEIVGFLSTFDEGCTDNIEFSEWSNELLFKVLRAQPNVFIKVLHSKRNLKTAFILSEIESPLVEDDITGLMNLLSRNSSYKKTRMKVINALKVAARQTDN